jgi:hypothetical protein
LAPPFGGLPSWAIVDEQPKRDGNMSVLIPSTETLVNTTTVSEQVYPNVAALSDGGYVVTWDSAARDGLYYDLYAQRYDALGQPVGGETLVNTTTVNCPTSAPMRQI